MQNVKYMYGINGQVAPSLRVNKWIGSDGKNMDGIDLKDMIGKYKLIYCFQAWCPGCHKTGFPALQKIVREMEGNSRITFLAIQTVFEGHHANTVDKLRDMQKQYDLKIPFAHDVGGGTDSGHISYTMKDYRIGGTPWYILLDDQNKVLFNDFHLDADEMIKFLKTI